MEQSLVEHLNRKLSQLERKVQAYRQDLVCEFGRYYGETLRDVDAPTATRISHTVAQSLDDRYPELGFGGELRRLITSTNSESGLDKPGLLATASGPSATNKMDSNLDSTQSIDSHRQAPPHTAVFGAAVAGARQSHERERESEFHGLFTPSFLPLLESSPNLSTSASPPNPITTTAVTSSNEPAIAGSDFDTNMGKGKKSPGSVDSDSLQTMQVQVRQLEGIEGQNETAQVSSAPNSREEHHPRPDSTIALQTTIQEPLQESRPIQIRRGTDETLSSVLSDKSDTTTRRSALRRSSSSSKPHQQSVRRVRFELRGAEVLPTASPQASDLISIQPSASSNSSDKSTVFDDPIDEHGDFEMPSLPPRKISSSEALRALSRAPLDESTVWTVVDSAGDRLSSPASKEQPPSPSTFDMTTTGKLHMPESKESIEARKRLSAISTAQANESPEHSDSSSDEEFLSIGKARSRNTATTPMPKAKAAPTQSLKAADDARIEQPSSISRETMSTDAPNSDEEDQDLISSDDLDAEDDDAMFHFESGGLSAPPVPKKKPLLTRDEVEDHPPPSPDKETDLLSTFATSPAIAITRPQLSSGSSTPTGSKFQVGSLGSYKGRPVIMPIVKDPELLAQAESLGDFPTFVGSVKDRSVIDDSDFNSFRASLVQSGFSGTPRSLTERMMIEEHAERNKGR